MFVVVAVSANGIYWNVVVLPCTFRAAALLLEFLYTDYCHPPEDETLFDELIELAKEHRLARLHGLISNARSLMSPTTDELAEQVCVSPPCFATQ